MTRWVSVVCLIACAAACHGGGSPNDFGQGPSDDAPTAPGAPADPNAPPVNPNDPPVSGASGSKDRNCSIACSSIERGCPEAFNDPGCVMFCAAIPLACVEPALLAAYCHASEICGRDPDDPDPILPGCPAENIAITECLVREDAVHPPEGPWSCQADDTGDFCSCSVEDTDAGASSCPPGYPCCLWDGAEYCDCHTITEAECQSALGEGYFRRETCPP